MTEKQAARKLASINKRIRALEAEAKLVYDEVRQTYNPNGIMPAPQFKSQYATRIGILMPMAKVMDNLFEAERSTRHASEIFRGNPFYYETTRDGSWSY